MCVSITNQQEMGTYKAEPRKKARRTAMKRRWDEDKKKEPHRLRLQLNEKGALLSAKQNGKAEGELWRSRSKQRERESVCVCVCI
jgi:hypothetical protein